ncbi:unnamed protein product [Rhizophagus irregularis]|nr:unnamed protein product [Rhizophagus irregularis]
MESLKSIRENLRVVKLWVLIENENPVKLSVKWKITDPEPDLADIEPRLCEKEVLSDVQPESLEFFRYGDRITPICPGTLVSTLNTTDQDPLVVRYPLSDSQVVVRCNLFTTWYKKRFPHNSGLWYLIRHEAETKWENLRNSQYFFVYSQDNKKSEEEQIMNEFALNNIVANIQPSEDSDEREISLSIRVKGKKAYDDWEIGEVLKEFLHQDGSSIGDIPTFKMDDLKNPDPEITQVELKLFVDELKKKKVLSNMLFIKAKEWLDGSCGYGPTDFAAYVESILALVAVVKKEDFEKGAAQNIVQIRSAVETLTRKRKKIGEIDNSDSDKVPVLMYGIVTNALQWYFIRWAGSPEDPTIEVSGPHQCEFDSEELEQAKQIVKYIVSILQHQVRGLKNEEVRHQIKKRRQKFF